MYCDCCPTRRMDSFRPYLNLTLCSLGHYQNLGNLYPRFSTGPIRRVSQHLILLTLFFVPPHQLSVGFIFEKALQTWYYWKIPHHLSGNFFLGGLPVNITRTILPNIVLFCVANRTSIQFCIFAAIENTVVRTCVNFLYL